MKTEHGLGTKTLLNEKEKPITKEEARAIVSRFIIGYLVLYKELPKKLEPFSQYLAKYNIDRIKEAFRDLIKELKAIEKDAKEKNKRKVVD